MNYIISIVAPRDLDELAAIHESLSVPVSVTMLGRGTAVQSMLDLLGIDSNEKRIVMAIANTEKAIKLIAEIKQRLYVGVPGHGIVVSIPIRSIGGGKTVNVLSEGEKPVKEMPQTSNKYELIVVIANEGRTDAVMNAARSAGATGGTVLHGKGTAAEEAAHFLKISIASEKEVILMVTKKEQKIGVMRAILESAGPGMEAGAILFSVPVATVAGFGMIEEA